MAYGYISTMRVKPGFTDQVLAIVLSGVHSLRDLGCEQFVVGVDPGDDSLIVVTEIWRDKEAHDASLRFPSAQAAIVQAMPMLTGEFTRQEVTIRGGLGISPSS